VLRGYAQHAIAEMIHHPCLVLEVIEVMNPARIKDGQLIVCCGADLAISRRPRLMAGRGESDTRAAGCFLEEARKVCGHGLGVAISYAPDLARMIFDATFFWCSLATCSGWRRPREW
jgi:hypothetical protein